MNNLRKSIPHLCDLSLPRMRAIVNDDIMYNIVTEKTDGMAFEFGIDEEGFWSRSSNSLKMRGYEPYRKASIARFGDAADRKITDPFDYYHGMFCKTIVSDDMWSIRGELFPSIHVDKKALYDAIADTVTYVGTPYCNKIIGGGVFVIHSQQDYNISVEGILDIFASVGDIYSPTQICIDEDTLPDIPGIDVSNIKDELNTYPLRMSVEYRDKFADIKKRLEQMLLHHLENINIKPMWGKYAEGYIFHHKNGNFKIIDPNWKQRKDKIWVAT